MLHRVIPLRGLYQELGIAQLEPTPAYTDSQSTIFCANAAASARLSVWVNRRAAILREAVDQFVIAMNKISDADNCANYYTKPVTTVVMNHYFEYMLPQGRTLDFAAWRRDYLASLQSVPAALSNLTVNVIAGYNSGPLEPLIVQRPDMSNSSAWIHNPHQAVEWAVDVIGSDDYATGSSNVRDGHRVDHVSQRQRYVQPSVKRVEPHNRMISRSRRRHFLASIATGIEQLAVRDDDQEQLHAAVGASLQQRWAMFMGFNLTRDSISPTVCTTLRSESLMAMNMRDVYHESQASVWCTPPKLQVYIAVGEIAQTPDGAIGDIVCISDKYKRVVIRDAQGFLHRARKEKLRKPLRRDRAQFYIDFARTRKLGPTVTSCPLSQNYDSGDAGSSTDPLPARRLPALDSDAAAGLQWLGTGSLTTEEALDTSQSQGSSTPVHE